ncbi:MAG: response regulator, partial [Verrucomicrobia bacterium]|nr:response regulator [Verrucomicrobiota bacterium]
KGTTVQTFFPALKHEPELALGLTAGPKMRQGTETILVVEDETSLRGPIRSILERQGFRVLEAGSGVEALAVWKQHCAEVDLLLVDVVMPDGMSGPDLVDTLRLDQPGLKVLFTSGYLPNVAAVRRPLKEGVNFLQKPYPAHKLVDTVRNCLDAGVAPDGPGE